MWLNAKNLGIGRDRVENMLWQTISLSLPSSVQIIVVQCGTNKISTDSPQRKSNTVNIICGFMPCDECWSVNRLLINKVNDILKYESVTTMVLFLLYRIMGGLSRMDLLIVPSSTKIPYILLSNEILNWQNQ